MIFHRAIILFTTFHFIFFFIYIFISRTRASCIYNAHTHTYKWELWQLFSSLLCIVVILVIIVEYFSSIRNIFLILLFYRIFCCCCLFRIYYTRFSCDSQIFCVCRAILCIDIILTWGVQPLFNLYNDKNLIQVHAYNQHISCNKIKTKNEPKKK